MSRFFYLFLLFFTAQFAFATDVIVIGKIGTYAIEMTVNSVDWDSGEVKGKYRYANKTTYLSLFGNLYGSCIYLEESDQDKVTGHFYLDYKDGALKGKWISNNNVLDVIIEWTEDLSKKLMYKENTPSSEATNDAITGTYSTGSYFLNEMWLTSEHPEMEIGFNGGYAVIEEIHPDSIHFLVEVTCGPTYHTAYAQGIASKIGSDNYYCLFTVYEGDTCEIFFDFTPQSTTIYAKSTSQFSCGFGARAYLEHDFIKVDDAVDFAREE